jgi:hypothetical protein
VTVHHEQARKRPLPPCAWVCLQPVEKMAEEGRGEEVGRSHAATVQPRRMVRTQPLLHSCLMEMALLTIVPLGKQWKLRLASQLEAALDARQHRRSFADHDCWDPALASEAQESVLPVQQHWQPVSAAVFARVLILQQEVQEGPARSLMGRDGH